MGGSYLVGELVHDVRSVLVGLGVLLESHDQSVVKEVGLGPAGLLPRVLQGCVL